MKKYLLLFFLSSMYVLRAQIHPRQQLSFDVIYNNTSGTNWTYQLDELNNRSESPYVTYGNIRGSEADFPGQTGRYFYIFDVSNNNLEGTIPESAVINTAYTRPYMWNPRNRAEIKLSHNNITHIDNRLGRITTGYINSLWVDNNNLTTFERDLSGVSVLGIGLMELTLHQNEISEIKPNSITREGRIEIGVLNNRAELFRIDNNRLDFSNLVDAVTEARAATGYISFRLPGNPDVVIDYLPQKPLGGDYTAQTLPSGAPKTLSFNLTHPDNVYSWQLNGEDVPLSFTNNYRFTVNENTAGVWRCKITNPNLPEAELYSYDMAVFMDKANNQSVTNIQHTQESLGDNFPEDGIVATFSATDLDGDKVYYRLPDKTLDNSHFRIKNGNTLVSAEPLFDRNYISEYNITVIAYDIYGGTFSKNITITKNGSSSNPLPSNITLTKSELAENIVNAEVGELLLVNDQGANLAINNADGLDNALFYIDGNILKNNTAFDFETRTQYTIRISAVNGTNTLKKDFTINVTDANDAPNEVTINNNTTETNLPAGTLVGYLLASDQDPVDTQFTYELISGMDDFLIQENRLITQRTFSSEETKTITVRVTDPRGAATDQIIEILVTAAGNTSTNLPPRGIGLSNTVLFDDMNVGDVLAIIRMDDPDGDLGTFTLNNAYYAIEGNSLKVTQIPTANELITIQYSDGTNTGSQDFNIQREGIASSTTPTSIGVNNLIMVQDWTVGTVVTELFMKDADKDNATFTLEAGLDSDYFEIDGQFLKIRTSLNDRHENRFVVSIKATDESNNEIIQTLEFFIADSTLSVDDPDNYTTALIYPNPVADQLHIRLDNSVNENFRLTIYNIYGSIVHTEVFNKNTNRFSKQLNVSGYAEGVYFIKITSQSSSYENGIKFLKR